MKKGSLHFEPQHCHILRKSKEKEKDTKEGHAKHHKDLLRHKHQINNQPEEVVEAQAMETISVPEADVQIILVWSSSLYFLFDVEEALDLNF
eukprot:15354937-Ditylum_brightwellii.AAC.1